MVLTRKKLNNFRRKTCLDIS